MNNTELTFDQLAEVAGGFLHHANVDKLVGGTMCSFRKTNPQWQEICDAVTSVKGDLKTGDLLGKKGKKNTNYDCQDLSANPSYLSQN